MDYLSSYQSMSENLCSLLRNEWWVKQDYDSALLIVINLKFIVYNNNNILYTLLPFLLIFLVQLLLILAELFSLGCTPGLVNMSKGNSAQSIRGHGHVQLLPYIWCHCGRLVIFFFVLTKLLSVCLFILERENLIF